MFVYTLPLKTDLHLENQLNKRFEMAEDIYQKTLREILKRTRKQKKDPRYKKAYKLPKGAKRNEILKELDKDYNLKGQFTFGKFANDYRNKRNYAPYIPSDVAGKLGIRAWEAYSKVKFAKGAKHIRLNEELMSFEAKGNAGIIIRNGILKMGTKQAKIEVPVIYKEDDFEVNALSNTFKYNRITRKKVKNRYKFYVQMIFDGTPPQRESYLTGRVGIDIGTSTIATSSHYQTELLELAKNINKNDDKIRVLQRKLDRQRRSNNTDNYNEDGTIKGGKKQWQDSKRYKQTKNELANIKRKQSEARRLSHKTTANQIVQMGDSFVVEQMSFKGLQVKSKEAKQNEKTGRYQSRKRFGSSISHRAPAMLIEEIHYKAKFQGKTFIKANTYKVKASQLDHVTEEYKKVSLSTRSKEVGGEKVQRDLYSAFLLQHLKDDGETVDTEACKENFDIFLRNQKITMDNLDVATSTVGSLNY